MGESFTNPRPYSPGCQDVRAHPATAVHDGFRPALCQPRLTAMDVADIATALASEDPAVGLRACLALRRLAERGEASQVEAARMLGWSWRQIGDALGVSRQSVHAKYGKAVG
jgi:hypothetical protein